MTLCKAAKLHWLTLTLMDLGSVHLANHPENLEGLVLCPSYPARNAFRGPGDNNSHHILGPEFVQLSRASAQEE